MTKNIAYLVALQKVDGLGPIRLKRLLEYYKDPKNAWNGSRNEFLQLGIKENISESLSNLKKSFDPEKNYDLIIKSGIKVITLFDKEYPQDLKQIYDPPIILFYKGNLVSLNTSCVAVVGSRWPTGYGRMVTESLTKDLVLNGFTIISGLAKGVDSVAHKTAVINAGKTIAVLGSGLNNIYPSQNAGLAQQIIEAGGAIVSEYLPETEPFATNFPKRNRIISALSRGVLVTEGAEGSGSLITARIASEQGKDVFAVPGPVNSNLSKGPARLIQQGAKLVLSVEDILEESGYVVKATKKFITETSDDLTVNEKLIVDLLENETKHIDELIRLSGLHSSKVSAALIKMEISGILKNLGEGNYVKAI